MSMMQVMEKRCCGNRSATAAAAAAAVITQRLLKSSCDVILSSPQRPPCWLCPRVVFAVLALLGGNAGCPQNSAKWALAATNSFRSHDDTAVLSFFSPLPVPEGSD